MNRPFSAALCLTLAAAATAPAQINQVQEIAPRIYFHEGDLKAKGHCNNGWVIFEDYVLVIDGNFPSGAQEIIPKIKAQTDKPIRFAFDTHHHGDHAYGNQIWADQGAVPVAYSGVVEEMKKYETGYYGNKPGRWEDTAKDRKDVANTKLKPPTLLFNHDLIFDDGKRRVELLHFGVAHTHGDGFAWLPKERILFTGDAVVNGPYNFVGDGNVTQWIKTLEAVKSLKPQVVCPGHGPMGGSEILDHQQAYFVALQREVKKRAKSIKTPDQLKTAVESIRTSLKADANIARYVGDFLAAQVEKVRLELGAKPITTTSSWEEERQRHAAAHGHHTHAH